MDAPRPWAVAAASLVVGVALPLTGSLVVTGQWPDWRFVHEPFHAVVEALGGFIALTVAGLLVNRLQVRQTRSIDGWIAAALASMGVLDIAHAAVMPGESFVWFHSAATLSGGVLFGAIAAGPTGARPAWIALGTAVVVALGSLLLLPPPTMVEDGAFTMTARAMNIAGGLGFYLAGLVFLLRLRAQRSWDDALFAGHCILFGSAGVLFELSTLWDGAWWFWHVLRVLAYAVAVAFVVFDSTRNERRLLELNHELDLRNEALEARIGKETERRRALEEQRWLARLEHTQRLESLGVLAGGIAHDFNNLLVGMLGNAQLASSHLTKGPALQSIQLIEVAARRAADLTRQMLAFSGQGRFVTETIDLNQEVAEMRDLLASGASANATFRQILSEDALWVRADRGQLQQVVMNLITNASDALGPEGGVITLRSGRWQASQDDLDSMQVGADDLKPGPFAYLEVSDTGCGMDEATQARMFDPFYTTKAQGRGLGMAATLGIVRGHTGAMRVHSEPSRGTTVRMILPAVEEPPAVDEPSTLSEVTAREGLVLVVDDEPAVLDFLETALPHLGYDVVLAENGQQALRIASERGDELIGVILDVTMPGMTGEQVFRELNGLAPELPVLVSSGFSADDIASRFPGKRLQGFLQKPYRLGELSEKLQQFTQG